MNNLETVHTVNIPYMNSSEHVDLKIRKINNTTWVETDDFIAKLNYLKILTYTAQGFEIIEIAEKLSLHFQTVKNLLTEAKIKNTIEIEGKIKYPTRIELIIKAYQLGLLNPMALIGIESIANADGNEQYNPKADL